MDKGRTKQNDINHDSYIHPPPNNGPYNRVFVAQKNIFTSENAHLNKSGEHKNPRR